MIKKLVILLSLTFTFTTTSGCQDVTETLLIGGTDVPYHKLAMNMFPRNRTAGSLASQMAEIKALGITSIRVTFWFDTFYMRSASSSHDFEKFDEVVNAAAAEGLEIVAILAYVPDWLQGSSSWKSTFVNEYVTPVVSRYKNSVKYWEIWNEPDELKYNVLDGSVGAYFNLLETVSPVIRSIDPSAKIVAAATVNIVADGLDKFDWTKTLINMGLKSYADVLNIHYYADVEFELSAVGGPMVQDANMAVWVTEVGVTGQSNQYGYFINNMAWIEKSLAPERIYWYTYIQGAGEDEETHPDETYGLVTYYGNVRYESFLYTHLKER